MTIIGSGLNLFGGHFNTSLVVVAFHSGWPITCEGLKITAFANRVPVLFVHTHGYSHPEMTIFNSLRELSANFLAGLYEAWIQPNPTLMHLDCFDNFLTIPAEKILERMAAFDTDLLIGLEENCWPDPTQVWSGENRKAGQYLELFESAPHIRTPNCLVPDFRFANLGGIIGTPSAMHDMADWVLARYPSGECIPGEHTPNDQACLHHFILEGMDRTGSSPKLDCGHLFFPMWDFFMDNVYPYVHLEKTAPSEWPAVFHTNGHVTKPVNDELKKCLSSDVNDGFVFPLELERATLQEWEPVAQNMLLPLCRHLKSLATEMEDTGNSETEYDSGVFKWL